MRDKRQTRPKTLKVSRRQSRPRVERPRISVLAVLEVRELDTEDSTPLRDRLRNREVLALQVDLSDLLWCSQRSLEKAFTAIIKRLRREATYAPGLQATNCTCSIFGAKV